MPEANREREEGLRVAAERLDLKLAPGDSPGRYRLFDAWRQSLTGPDLDLDEVEFYVGSEPVRRRDREEFIAEVRFEHPESEDETLRRIDERQRADEREKPDA